MKDIYTFKREYDYAMTGAKGTVTHEIEAVDWHTLAQEFHEFLKGSGFGVSRADLAEFYTDYEPMENDYEPS